MSGTVLHVGGASPYDVVVGRDLADRLPALLGPSVQRVAVLYSDRQAELAQPLVEGLVEHHDVLALGLPDGEAAKTASVANDCWEALGERGFTRSDAVVTFGGGAVTDLGGFVAATWLRGVAVVHVPTTLLGMVDAAVGGKTGINTAAGKNLVGCLPRARRRAVRPRDARHAAARGPRRRAGRGREVRLHRRPADPGAGRGAPTRPSLTPDSPVLRELVERAIRVKIDVVVGDLKETGAGGGVGRELLNYGHTLAHAVERAEGYRMRHGDAVAIGCVYAAELAGLRGLLDAATVDRHRDVLQRVGLPTTYANAGLRGAARHDAGGQEGARVADPVRGAGGRRPRRWCSNPTEEQLRAAWERIGGGAADERCCGAERAEPRAAGSAAAGDLRHHDPRRAGRAVRRLGPRARARGRDPADQPRGRPRSTGSTRPPTRRSRSCSTPARGPTTRSRSSTPAPSSTAPLVEVHISDPKQRPEEFRHTSVVEPHAVATIAGQGIDGYRQALEVVAARSGLTGRVGTATPAPCCHDCCQPTGRERTCGGDDGADGGAARAARRPGRPAPGRSGRSRSSAWCAGGSWSACCRDSRCCCWPAQPGRATGVTSDDGFVMGQFTLCGSLNLCLVGTFLGVLGAGLLRRPPRPPGRALVVPAAVPLGRAGGVVVGSQVVHSDGVDFRVLEPLWLAVALFVLLPTVYVALLSVVSERLLARAAVADAGRRRRPGVVAGGLRAAAAARRAGARAGGAPSGRPHRPGRRALASPVGPWLLRAALAVVFVLALADLVRAAATSRALRPAVPRTVRDPDRERTPLHATGTGRPRPVRPRTPEERRRTWNAR